MGAIKKRGRKPRLGRTLIADPARRLTPDEVLAALDQSPALPTTATCLNEGCNRLCHWNTGPGNQSLFCSQACRLSHRTNRLLLQAEITALEDALKCDGLNQARTFALRSHMLRRRWLLARYPEARAALKSSD